MVPDLWLETIVFRGGESRAVRCFLGVHKYTAKWATEGDMGWESWPIKGEM